MEAAPESQDGQLSQNRQITTSGFFSYFALALSAPLLLYLF
jgi:hypothetical protein